MKAWHNNVENETKIVHGKIEILSVELLAQCRPLVTDLQRVAHSLGLEFGWHYLLDLTWILKQLGSVNGKRVMDAGAGTGVLQWYLAQEGAEVISVDRLSRAALPLRFRRRFRVRGLRQEDLLPPSQAFKDNSTRKIDGYPLRQWALKTILQARDLVGWMHPPQGEGRVLIYNQDLTNLADIQDNTLDAVVAVSSLEHNPPQILEQVVAEIMRVLKPGSMLLATLNAGRDQDWWHEASSGWCYTDASLRRIFRLPVDVPSNYESYDELFTTLRNCTELQENLAGFYFQSDKNGMPWGIWNPQYQPVGVCKVKEA